jgi:hypothetical protein
VLLCKAVSIKEDLGIINKVDDTTNVPCTSIDEDLSLQSINVRTSNLAMTEELGICVSALNTLISNKDTIFKQSISKQLDW